jgi:hypothetical protein
MFLNVSKCPQAIVDNFLQYQSIYPNEAVNEYAFPSISSIPAFKKIKKFDFSKYKKILIKRGHALGDVIMTIPIMNYLKSLGKEVYINTSGQYIIKGVDCILGHPPHFCEKFDLILNLDGVVERDHYDKKLFELNRVDIYKKAIGLEKIGNNWDIEYPKIDIDLQNAVIGIQISGSVANCKSINLTPLLSKLDKQGIRFYIIDNSSRIYSYKNHVRIATDVLGLLNIFSRLKGIICFDSSPLWISHVTNTPAFCVVGPTSGPKIIARHPNKKSVFYDTKLDFSCKSQKHGCGESASDCNKQFSCLKNVNHEKLFTTVINWIKGL